MNLLRRLAALFRPGREHSAASAVALLMAATLLARLLGFLREVYIAWAFGAGPLTDAYVAAFTLPDLLLYMFAGGAISISFVSLYGRSLADGREQEAERALSVIVSTLALAFALVAVIGVLFAPWFTARWFPGFSPEQRALCAKLTRVLMPQPLCFLVGGVLSAVLQARRRFLIPAFAPLVYTLAIILGGLLLSRRLGIASLAWGATVGALLGPLLLNGIGAASAGLKARFSLDWKLPAFREWLGLSIPLMLGVSVVVADDWICRYFAAGDAGAITRLNYAKRLLQMPIGVFGQAAGVAALPFFAKLWGEGKRGEYDAAVNGAVSRLAALNLLAAGALAAVAGPLVELAFRRGKFTPGDARVTAAYFAWFVLALVFWAVQGIYARGFFAAGDMVRPMVAGTLITALSIPVYALFHKLWGTTGLVFASNLAILAQTAALALMLNRRRWVRLRNLDWPELRKTAIAALAGWGAARLALQIVPFTGGRRAALAALLAASLAWLWAAGVILWISRAKGPRELWARVKAKTGAGHATGETTAAVP